MCNASASKGQYMVYPGSMICGGDGGRACSQDGGSLHQSTIWNKRRMATHGHP